MGRTNIQVDTRLVEKGSLYCAVRRLRGKLTWEGEVGTWRSARRTRA